VILEKPFGRDRRTSDELVGAVSEVFREEQVFRIDHYLGKEVIQNLLVLRFANLIFEPIWNRTYVKNVEIVWKEDIGVEGRGGYFDDFGIIRDVLQNHLLQILALLAMEPPSRFQPRNLAAEKLRVLEAIPPVRAEDIVIGQYGPATVEGTRMSGYREDASVGDDSRTPTFAAVRLAVENHRWKGVPFYVTAGKALDDKMTEIRIQFYELAHNIFCEPTTCPRPNRLVIRVQPDESISLHITNKVPGMAMEIAQHRLNLQYKTTFDKTIPEAYERLLLDVIQGDRGQFIGAEELAAAWDVFTPILDRIDREAWMPQPYEFGGKGPDLTPLHRSGDSERAW
jgi:glucose-6-phosphate 1-dehydrogenase